ncbi:MAG: hypothetical protein M1835_000192 [Candelina submexicana]|nr:MAG: hypothetical protein M1835_000192 [Candelina submexicana]
MAANNMHNLTTLIKRLEAATSRLEDMAQATMDPSAQTNGIAPPISTTAGGAFGGDAGGSAPAPGQITELLPPAIDDFDALMNDEVKTFVNTSEELGGLVAEQSAGVLRAFAAQRKFLIVTTKAKKPDIQSPVYMEILKELQTMMGTVGDIREANRASPLFTHLTCVSEGIAALGWITIDPKPVAYIQEIQVQAEYFGNRVLKEYRDKDQVHVEWVQSYYKIFKALSSYVQQHYPQGVTWNNKDGIDAKEALDQIQSGNTSKTSPGPTSAAGGAPPPPPPPPPLPQFDGSGPPPPPSAAKGASPGGDMGEVFNQLNRGEAVTAGLRKVDRSEMTHKNPSLRASAPVPTRSDSQNSTSSGSRGLPPGKKPKPENMRTKRPPRKELDGNKWIIENFENHQAPIEISASINQSILIYRCRSTVIRVVGKANAISLDNSERVSLIIDSLVSSVDVIKSPNFALQVIGTLPTIMLDQVDGATVYLSRESLGCEIFTSKCTSVNINLPPEGTAGEDDYRECPLPEQVRSIIRGGRVISEIVEHAG